MSSNEPNDQIIMNKLIVSELYKYRSISKVSPLVLLRRNKEKFEGLRLKELESWLDMHSVGRYVSKVLLNKVREAWEKEAQKEALKASKRNRVKITDDYLLKLKAEIRRTGVKPAKFQKRYETVYPNLSRNTIGTWLRKNARTADIKLLNGVLDTYEGLPDSPAGERMKNYVEPVSEEDLALIRLYRDNLNLLPGHIFKTTNFIPEGLNQYKLSKVLNGQTQKMNPVHLNWVKEQCRKLIEEAYEAAKKSPP